MADNAPTSTNSTTGTNIPVTDGSASIQDAANASQNAPTSTSGATGTSGATDSSTTNVPNTPSGEKSTQAPSTQPEGASGPVTDSAKVEQQTSPDSVALGSAPVGATAPGLSPDPVLVNQYLSGMFNDVEAVLQRAEAVLAATVDVSGLRDHLNGARDWLADKLGLDKNDDGTYLTHSGYAANPSMLGQTTGQAETPQKGSDPSSDPSSDPTSSSFSK